MKRVILLGANDNVSVESFDSILKVEDYVSPNYGITYEMHIKTIPTTNGALYLMTDDGLGAYETEEEVMALHNEKASKLVGKDVYGNCAVVKMTSYDPNTYDPENESTDPNAEWLELNDEDINNVLGVIKYEI